MALGADVHGRVNCRNDCVLWMAAGSDISMDLFEALVHTKVPYKPEPESRSSPLHAAAKAGNLRIVAYLLESREHHFKIDVNDRDSLGRTALHDAASKCNESIVEFLLKQRNISANCQDTDSYTPFLLAIEAVADHSKKYATIKKLIRNKLIDCNLGRERYEKALHLAATSRDATLNIIMKHVHGINSKDSNGRTPPHKAVEGNCKRNIRTLLKHGADPTIVNESDLTLLLLACTKRHLGPMELLLSQPQSLTTHCPTPIKGFSTFCHHVYDHWSPVTVVLQDVASVGKKTKTHLGLALKVILRAAPDLEIRDDLGRSVLNRVVNNVTEDMLQDLLQAGADVNSQDHWGRTPLHGLLSSYSFCHKKLKLLLKWGADPDLRDNDGEPADCERPYSHLGKDIMAVLRQHMMEKEQRETKETLKMLSEKAKAYAIIRSRRNPTRMEPNHRATLFRYWLWKGRSSKRTKMMADRDKTLLSDQMWGWLGYFNLTKGSKQIRSIEKVEDRVKGRYQRCKVRKEF